MNILLINYEFPPLGAGASTATWHIGKELVKMGYKITVLTSQFKKQRGYDFKEGMTIFRCPAIRKKISESNMLEMLSFVISAFFFLPWIILKYRIQGTIVFFSFPCGPLGLWAKLLFGIPYVISLRGGDVPGTEKKLDRIHKILQPFRRLLFKKSKAVIANSKGLKQLSQKVDSVSISVIPNGVDTAYFRPLKEQIKKDFFSFVFAGRLSEQKNLFFLIEQFSVLKNRVNNPFVLNIVGDGPLKDELQQFADRLGISDRIKWHGWLTKDQILELLQNSECFINPSLYEGMPNAVLEAMACGMPVIASKVAGNDTLIKDGENGFLFNLDDDKKIQNAFKIVTEQSSRRLKMGKNALKMIRKEYSWHKAAKDYSRILS